MVKLARTKRSSQFVSGELEQGANGIFRDSLWQTNFDVKHEAIHTQMVYSDFEVAAFTYIHLLLFMALCDIRAPGAVGSDPSSRHAGDA